MTQTTATTPYASLTDEELSRAASEAESIIVGCALMGAPSPVSQDELRALREELLRRGQASPA